MRGGFLAASALAVALVSCGEHSIAPRAITRERVARLAEPTQSYSEGRLGLIPNAAPASVAGAVAAQDLLAIRVPAPTPSMVIRTGQASVEVDSLEPAIALIREFARRAGGYVANAVVQTGGGQLRSASLEVKIPADRFDEALGALAPIGKLESVNIKSDDVGEEYFDVTARIENARRLETRLIGILANRTGRLKDVLDVEQALARVREEIERYEGRLRYLKAHVAMSTLAAYLHEPIPVVGRVGSSVMGEAVKQAWRNFVWLVALLIQSLGVVVPLGVLATAGWIAVSRWRKARAPRPAEA